MKELALKYGCNPNQKPARIFMEEGELPVKVLSGRPGYINFLDALNGYQLVSELKAATGLPAAASFKHVSPAARRSAWNWMKRCARSICAKGRRAFSARLRVCARARRGPHVLLRRLHRPERPLRCAHGQADRPRGIGWDHRAGYEPEALEILKNKRKGAYNVVEIDPAYRPAALERKMCYGITFEQGHNDIQLQASMLENRPTANKEIPDSAMRDLLIALIALKYTQSNSVCYALGGQTIGVARASSRASTARAWRAIRPIAGICGSIPRSWRSSSARVWAGLTAITPSTSTFPRSGKTCWATMCGSSISRCGLSRSPHRKSANGSRA